MNKAHRTLLAAMAALALFAVGAVVAFAGAPTFLPQKIIATITSSTTTSVSAATSAADASLAATSTTTDVLRVSFQEIRLRENTGIDYTVTADASVTYACINGGSKNPKASNKLTVAGPVSGGGTFTSDTNGNVKGTIEVTPPGPGDFTCPTGQQLVLAKLLFTDITLEDTTNKIFAGSIPDQTKTYFNL